MDSQTKETDQEIMARLREPINELINKHCSDKTEYQRLRLRQLSWQAVDVLIRKKSVANLENEPNIKRITRDIKELGASEEFIQESLALAVSIYSKIKINYPSLLESYGS